MARTMRSWNSALRSVLMRTPAMMLSTSAPGSILLCRSAVTLANVWGLMLRITMSASVDRLTVVVGHADAVDALHVQPARLPRIRGDDALGRGQPFVQNALDDRFAHHAAADEGDLVEL